MAKNKIRVVRLTKEESTPVFARVDNSTLAKLQKLAHPESMSVLLRKIIREYLAKKKC